MTLLRRDQQSVVGCGGSLGDGRTVAIKKVDIFEMSAKKRERCMQEVQLLGRAAAGAREGGREGGAQCMHEGGRDGTRLQAAAHTHISLTAHTHLSLSLTRR